MTPEVVGHLLKLGFEITVETGAGELAAFADEAYRAAGAHIAKDAPSLYAGADIVVKVRAPSIEPAADEVVWLREGSTLISFIWPAQNDALLTRLNARNITVLAMDCVPRISRAQKLDALSSMANMAGYRAVIEAAHQFGRGFMGQITAAGKIAPAKVMVIGAGVAGLAAIGAARSLGAIVRAFDTRPEVRQQVESMGAEFLELDYAEDGSGSGSGGYAKEMSPEFIAAEMALFAAQAKEVDVIVTTALIPGKPAPKLITADMVRSMRQGSVIVDMAAEQGGNCQLTQPGEAAFVEGVTIVGYTDLPSRMATQSSQLYGTNLRHLLTDLTPQKNGEIVIDIDDEVIGGVTVVLRGQVRWPLPKRPAAVAPTVEKPAATIAVTVEQKRRAGWIGIAGLVLAAVLLAALGAVAPPAFVAHFTVFVLAIFVGYQVVWNVTPALHTPLMSVTNAVSGIIVTGALLQVGTPDGLVAILSGLAILIATINIAGGFLVTQRMLNMFQR
ncbi:NAD(P) transhydrogenase subunit alpha [Caballeronia insecticola]|uniref:NAD(P) transhydrogenase subunit alpha n=1 Tax=Caballeronia insecticola TaxID=758793 RepID=R4WPV8_9BURK|nr:NAD(P) transhydrogenase subunit alpha [Caballeronia insecticola]